MPSAKRTICSTAATTAAVTTVAASEVAGNDDLLAEVLLRLPLKSLVKYKLVSKHWHSLINSPVFSRRRNSIPILPTGLFLNGSEHLFCGRHHPSFAPGVCYIPINGNENQASHPLKPPSFFNDNPDIYILQSCNGLLCCCDSKLWNLYIVNPTTKQFSRPVQRNVEVRVLQCFGVSLVFDPSKSPHYKVICVRDTELSTSGTKYCQIEIYSSETSTWRLSGDPFTADTSTIQFSRGVFWNGAINWVSVSGDSLYFNVDQERLQTMPMPPMPPILQGGGPGPQFRKIRYFGESRGHLHLVELEDMKISEMEKDYSGWRIKYYVDLREVANAFPEMIPGYSRYSFSILCIVRRENDNESFLVLHTPGKIIHYYLKDGSFKKIIDLDPSWLGPEYTDKAGSVKFGWFNAYPYIESLSSV